LAGLIKQVRSQAFPKQETVLVNLTGGERRNAPHPGNVKWMRRDAGGWVEE
jgi:hypothetical protein